MTLTIPTFVKALLTGCVLALAASLPASAQHAQWTRLLSDYVHPGDDGVNRVDYAALKSNQADRAELDVYIASFADMDLSGRDDDTFADWANLYNAVTVRYIVQKYPLGSIRDGYVFGGPWKKIKVTADGKEISLDGIEHDVLRPRFGDPRVHYAINCAAWSCPNLQPVAWKGDTLDRDLDAAARAYINHPRGVSVSPRGLTVSTIYDWFKDDFGGSKAAVIQHLLKYAEPDLAEAIRKTPRIRGYEYDWSLNNFSHETQQ